MFPYWYYIPPFCPQLGCDWLVLQTVTRLWSALYALTWLWSALCTCLSDQDWSHWYLTLSFWYLSGSFTTWVSIWRLIGEDRISLCRVRLSRTVSLPSENRTQTDFHHDWKSWMHRLLIENACYVTDFSLAHLLSHRATFTTFHSIFLDTISFT